MVGQLAKRNGNGLRPSFPFPMSLRREMDELINRMWGVEPNWVSEDAFSPSMDLSETDDSYRVTLEMPGISTNEIDIQVNGNVLTISGERKEEKEEKGRTYHRTERSYGSVTRSVTLPCEVMEDRTEAKLEGGVLTVELPKAQKTKPCKVKVQGA